MRIDTEGAYANLILPSVLARSGLPDRDRAFVTQLVYGTTRLRRACDWFVDRFVHGDLDPEVRAATHARFGAHGIDGARIELLDVTRVTGDHLAYSPANGHLYAFRNAMWYRWSVQIESMKRLRGYAFEWVLPGHGRRHHADPVAMRGSLEKCIAWMERPEIVGTP